jgi:tetratricopeptide (TPR) repeat protein
MIRNTGMSAALGKEYPFEIVVNAPSVSSLRAWSMALIGGSCLLLAGIAHGQQAPGANSSRPAIEQHYEAAFRFQNAGNLDQADLEYKLFLAAALHRLANGRANLGDYVHAVSLYSEALRLTPDDRGLQMDYAGAALDAADWKKAKSLAASLLDAPGNNAQSPDPRAVAVLAQALLELGEHQQALEEFKAAAQLRPGFDTASQLAAAYLVLGDKSNAAKTLSELKTTSGDAAMLHMKLGILYGKAKFFDEAIEQFQTAIAKDNNLKGVHYSLGASYMMQSGEPGYDKAEAEYRKEVALDPDNPLVYLPLGRIALARHRYKEAEADLKRAVALNPRSAGTYLVLGQLYRETGNISEAIAALRKAIALTLDPSKNNYEVEQAHFWLGRLLIQSGSSVEGRKEMDISQNLLYLKEQLVESRLSGGATLQTPLDKTHEANPADLAAQKAFEKQVGAPIAGSYENLGVNAANDADYVNASSYFEQAAKWNPTLKDADKNWGRAAFAAKEYAQAVTPLSHALALEPADSHLRAMLGLSLCMVHEYARAVQVLRPIGPAVEANPELTIAYAGSIALSVDNAQGLARLKALQEANPGIALVHYLLGEVHAGNRDYGQAADELRIALKLDPSNTGAKNALALADLALGQKLEALQLFSELAESDSRDGEVYYQLARLQIESGSIQAAISSLETAIRLNPMDASYHLELAEAYRKNAQPEDAEHETRESETLQVQSEPNRPQVNVN